MLNIEDLLNDLDKFVEANKSKLIYDIPDFLPSSETKETYRELMRRVVLVTSARNKPETKDSGAWLGAMYYKHKAFRTIRTESLGCQSGLPESAIEFFKEVALKQLKSWYGEKFENEIEKWEVRIRPHTDHQTVTPATPS